MPELILHFGVEPGTNIDAIAAEVRQQLQVVEGVANANAKATQLRVMGGAVEIIAAITFLTTAVQGTTMLLKSVDDLIEAWRKLSLRFPKLDKPLLEIGRRKVPIDQVTEQDVREAFEE
jgi:hypothetical protein